MLNLPDPAHREMKSLFTEIANEVLHLQYDLSLLKAWGAQPELWLRNQIALRLHTRFAAKIMCEVAYQDSNQKLDLHITRAHQSYCIEIKVEGRKTESLLAVSGPIVQDVRKIYEYKESGINMVRSILAVAYTPQRTGELSNIFHRTAIGDPNSVLVTSGELTVLMLHIDNRRFRERSAKAVGS